MFMEKIENISFEEMKEIFNSLSDLEKSYILPESHKDKLEIGNYDSCIIRFGYFIDENCVGYIELYEVDDEACIVTAVKEEYRGKGIMKSLLNRVEELCKYNIFIKKLIWGCDVRNKLSQEIAKKYNFEFYKLEGNEIQYYKNN